MLSAEGYAVVVGVLYEYASRFLIILVLFSFSTFVLNVDTTFCSGNFMPYTRDSYTNCHTPHVLIWSNILDELT